MGCETLARKFEAIAYCRAVSVGPEIGLDSVKACAIGQVVQAIDALEGVPLAQGLVGGPVADNREQAGSQRLLSIEGCYLSLLSKPLARCAAEAKLDSLRPLISAANAWKLSRRRLYNSASRQPLRLRPLNKSPSPAGVL